jgi:methionyl-tRNA synthetase
VQRYDSDLANGLGNLSSRTLTMIQRYFQGKVPYPSAAAARTPADKGIATLAESVIKNYNQLFGEYQFSRALEAAWSLVGAVNKYIVEQEPWVVADKTDEESRSRLATILYTAAEALRVVTALVHPVIPESTRKIWEQLGLSKVEQVNPQALKWGDLTLGANLGTIEPVFPRSEKNAVERMQQMEQERVAGGVKPEAVPEPAGTGAVAGQPATQAAGGPAPSATNEPVTSTAAQRTTISIDDFAKVELRVGQVKTAEKVKGADKLLRLEVDIGTEVRQIVAGIALAYTPESLVGRKVVIVANLAPRKLRGIESNGMIVAASIGEQGSPVLAGFLEDVPIGARLK